MNRLRIGGDITKKETGQSFNEVLRTAENPQTQPNTAAKKITPITILRSCWDIVSKNPLISGIIALVLGTLILKYYHII